MDDIVEPTIDYDFSKLYLGPPTTLSGGAYFTRVMYNNNKQLYIQTPKSLTKQGFVKNGKKIFTDLMLLPWFGFVVLVGTNFLIKCF